MQRRASAKRELATQQRVIEVSTSARDNTKSCSTCASVGHGALCRQATMKSRSIMPHPSWLVRLQFHVHDHPPAGIARDLLARFVGSQQNRFG